MTGEQLLALLHRRGAEVVRMRGSHVRVRLHGCFVTVPVHRGEDLGPGLLRAIERELEPVLGRGWLKR